jgi:hypothetical protein
MGIGHKKAYWKRRLEADEMAKQVLVAKRSTNIDGRRYGPGSVLPAGRIPPRALQAMIDSRGAMWMPKSDFHPQPTDLPKPVAATPQPKPEIVHDNDIVDSWFFTENAMTKACNGNRALARDILFSDASCRDLYVRAQKEQCARVAKRLGRPSVSPNEAGMC